MDGEEVDWCYSLAWLGHGSLTPRASVQIRVAPLEESLQQKLWEKRGFCFSEDGRVVKATGLRSVDASLVGSIPTPRISIYTFFSIHKT
jgi:hypothetical protein